MKNKIITKSLGLLLMICIATMQLNLFNSYAQEVSNSLVEEKSAIETNRQLGTTTGTVNMRSGASTSYKVIKKLNKNAQVEVVKKVNNSWYQIKYGTSSGYISSKYLKVSTISSDNKNGTITGSVNMRTGPSTSYKIVTKLKSKDKVEIIYETSQRYFKWKEGWYELKNYIYVPVSPSLDKIKSNTWCKIKYNGKVGYVNSKYITITNGLSTGLSFSKMDDKMIDLGYESFDGYEVLGYNYGFRNEHLSDKYNNLILSYKQIRKAFILK